MERIINELSMKLSIIGTCPYSFADLGLFFLDPPLNLEPSNFKQLRYVLLRILEFSYLIQPIMNLGKGDISLDVRYNFSNLFAHEKI